MLTIFLSLLIIGGMMALIRYRIHSMVFLLFSFVALCAVHFIWWPPLVALLAVTWLIALFFKCLPSLRRTIITQPLMNWFKRQQPPLSITEKEALYAGGSWFEKQIFTGEPDWSKLYNLPKSTLTAAEQHFLDNEVETLCAMLDDWQINHELHDLPEAAWDYLKKNKFWGLVLDKKHGGLGFSALAHSAVICKVASKCIAAAINIMVPNSLGPAEFLHYYGTEEQKQKYIPKLAVGEEVACFALTSNDAGSDASRISDSGIIGYREIDGEKVLGITLNFQKRYITLAPIATLIGLAFQLYDPERLIGDRDYVGITCALVPADLPGVTRGERHSPMNLAFMNGPIEGKNVFIPIDNVIGGRENCGKGWRMLMECLSLGRGISLPGLATAATQLSLRMSAAYAKLRWQFKRPISDFEGVSYNLGRLAGFSYLCEATRQFNALAVDQNAKPALASAIAKYHVTEIGRQAVNHAMDIHAGRGVQNGPRNYLHSLYEGIPICITVEGANILTRNLIIFGQGVVRCHPYLQDEIITAEKNDLKGFDRLLWKHLGFIFANAIKATIGAASIRSRKIKSLRSAQKELDKLSSALTFVTECSLAILGAKLKLKENLSASLGDVLSHLYLASAVMKFYKDKGALRSDWPFAKWCIEYCLHQSETALFTVVENFPSRFGAGLLRCMVLPWGRRYRQPTYESTNSLIDAYYKDAELASRLTPAIYMATNINEPTGRIELAYQAWLEIEPLWQKCVKWDKSLNALSPSILEDRFTQWAAENKLTSSEAEKLQRFVAQRFDALMVDTFNFIEGNTDERRVTEKVEGFSS